MALIPRAGNPSLGAKPPGLSEKESAVKVFKVMTQKDRAFGGKFNPEKIEEALNAMGKEGWQIDGVTSAEFPSLTGGRQELVIFLSKDV
ncbi:MAG: hypothetical protein RIQ39_139 [Actinomycetota bacterium]|jgi:hypothetical protein